jgi:hypothetical protein
MKLEIVSDMVNSMIRILGCQPETIELPIDIERNLFASVGCASFPSAESNEIEDRKVKESSSTAGPRQ